MILYRRASMNDIPELIKLRIEFIASINKEAEIPEGFSEALFNYFNDKMQEDTFVSHLAIEKDKIVGTSGICFYTVPPSIKNPTGKTAYIMNMYTLDEYRHQGIASKLFEKILYEAMLKGHKRIYLHATDEGRPLYKKFGFKDTDNEMVFDL